MIGLPAGVEARSVYMTGDAAPLAAGIEHIHRARRRHPWRRLLLSAAALVMLSGMGCVAALAEVAGTLTRGTPTLTALLTRTPAQSTLIYDREGKLIATLHDATNRIVIASQKIPRLLKEATVAIEDKRFYTHHGVDFEALIRAALADLKAGCIVEGGSTITEQYIKNAYLGDDQTLARKVHEAILAWQLEDRWSKDRILTAYLNTVYYGQGAYGIQAAAQTYFHRNVWQLTLAQCALLAAVPRDPTGYSPIYAPTGALARRNLVLAQMEQQGYISKARLRRAERAKLTVYRRPLNTQAASADYFVEYVTEQLIRRYGVRETFEGGLKVYTSLDMRMQRDALAAMRDTLPAGPAGALVSIDASSGFIRAMATTTAYQSMKFNLATQAKRQLGSAMKPFALVAAVEEGANPQSTYYDSQPLHIYLGPHHVPPYWDVATYSHSYAGPINLVQATWQSDNTVYAQLAMDLGPERIVKVAHQMGITGSLPAWPSIVLGTDVVNPLEVADAYATLASGGIHHPPQAIERVVFADGHVEATAVAGKRVIPAAVAYVVDKILEGNTRYGTAAAMPNYYTGTAAGKTGTTSSLVDAWFCGFNPELATAVWMGYPHSEVPMPGVQGATYCVPIWGKYYQAVFGAQQVPDFSAPPVMPTWKPWQGAYGTNAPTLSSPQPTATPSAPSPSPVAVPSAQPSTTTRPAPTPSPSPTPTQTTPPPPTPPTPVQTPSTAPSSSASP